MPLNSGQYSIAKWISILHRNGQSYVTKKLKYYNIGSGQYIILLNLYSNDGISQEKLSDYLKIDKGSIAKSIKKLEDEAYIKRIIDSDDKRAYKVFLTQKALDTMPIVQKAIESWEEVIVADLTECERQMIESLLNKIAHKAYSIHKCE
ncbi:MAG: MarR family transcriptional regulator [Firmicutes bacterium]|nr:MarR family transcriptional regulator [Bacillota bacterium]